MSSLKLCLFFPSIFYKEKIWCGTHSTFSYHTLQQKNILLSALHSYLPHQWHSCNAQNLGPNLCQWQSGNVRNLKTRVARFKPRSRLSFGVFRGFLRNSRKYGLISLRKTPTESSPPIVPGPTSGQLDSCLHPSILCFFL